MRRRHTRTLPASVWFSALLSAGVVPWACRQAPDTVTSRSRASQLLDPKIDTGIALRAVALRDTIVVGDRAPVEVVYAIVNGALARWFDNEPGRFRFLVTGPDGQPANSLGGSPPAIGQGPPTDMMLPAGGVLVQRQDLRCVNDAAYSAVPFAMSSKDDCLAMYSLATPGRYQVVVEYFGHEVQDAVIVEGEHLADTVTFVVTAP